VAPAAFAYFCTAAGIIGCCVAGYLGLRCLPYAVHRLKSHGYCARGQPAQQQRPGARSAQPSTAEEDLREPLLAPGASTSAATAADAEAAAAGPSTSAAAGASSSSSSSSSSSVQQQHQHQHQRGPATLVLVEPPGPGGPARSWQQRHAFSIYCLVLLWTLAVTQMVHPGITSFICSVSNPATVSPCSPHADAGRYAGNLFVPSMYVVFSLGDFSGRLLAGCGPWGRAAPQPLALLAYSLLRTALAAGFLLCHVVTPTRWTLPELLRRDEHPVALILLLGLTQGHLLSTACMHAPSTLEPSQKHRYGPVSSFAVSVGCFAGSLVSLAVAYLFQTHAIG
jgi:equilibrative nucleoside transporter 1/2/3